MQGKIAGVVGLVAAWALVAAVEAQWIPVKLPGDLDRVIVVGLGAATVAYVVARTGRAAIDYKVLRLGREIERERRQQLDRLDRHYDEGPTIRTGIGG